MDNKSANQVVGTLEDFFKKLPSLPANIVDVLVAIAPWLALVFGILGVFGSLAGLGVLTAFTPLAAMSGEAQNYGFGFISVIGWLVSSVLMLVAFPGLKAKKAKGWSWLFWSEVVSLLASLLAMQFGSLIGAFIAFYLLFQMKPRFK